MLIEFRISNYRSIKEEQVLSFLPAEKLKTRINPLIDVDKYKNLKLLRSCVVFGKNNSGKSNLLLALNAFGYLVSKSHGFNLGDKLEPNEAFQFDVGTQNKPTTFQAEFIAKDGIRYDYLVSFDRETVHREELYFYPNPKSEKLKSSKLFTREGENYSFGERFKKAKKNIESGVLKNQLFLSKAVQNKTKQLNSVFEFFSRGMTVSVFHDTEYDEILLRSLGEFIFKNKNNPITDLIEQFIINSDTGIIGIKAVADKDIPKIEFPEDFPEEERVKLMEEFVKKFQYQVLTEHRLYKDGGEIGTATLPLKEQSTGTKKFFTMLRLVLVALKEGDLMVVDELDKSLHTEWTQLLIDLFHTPETNPKNAQLIFATHDTNLLSSDLFSRDQIYLIDKNKFGASELYALSSYTGLRNEIPYEKWYLSGRFGAVPQIFKSRLYNEIKKSPIFNE